MPEHVPVVPVSAPEPGPDIHRPTRRRWLARTGVAAAGILIAPLGAAASPATRGQNAARPAAPADADEGVSPPEDLMREHGVLKRVLLVYREAIRRIDGRQDLPPQAVRDGADIIRTFIEDYHEKLEEDHLFPRFERAGRLADLTAVLRAQHRAGRVLTGRSTQLATLQALKDAPSASRLKDAMHQFVRMYEPHEAREDTVLFPAIRSVVPPREFDVMGDAFEKMEHDLFGEDGFEKMVDRVAGIERTLGIYDLAQFTPAV
jgi:hemerythrin-like domain-containing protein